MFKIAAVKQSFYCPKCNKTMKEDNFYKNREGHHIEWCKKCITLHVDNFNPETFLWILEKLDFPYIANEWNVLRDRAYMKANGDPTKFNGMSVLGRYISKMRLGQWSKYKWDDTERLAEEAKEKEKKYLEEHEELINFEKEIQEKYERGEISEAEYKTFIGADKLNAAASPYPLPGPNPYGSNQPNAAAYGGSMGNPFNENNFMPEEDLIDVGAELTQDDKIYLATKWGRLYQPHEWISLEKLYQEFLDSFDIKGAARLDTLKKICKTSLKMDEAIDAGDVESYQKLSRVYDTLMKSGKFTEAQNKEEKVGEFDCVGQIVNFCESKKGGGKIPRYNIQVERDIVDKSMNELKNYYVTLIENDPTIKQQIENWFKKRNNLKNKEKDEEEARKKGLDRYELTDEDIINSKKYEEEQRKADDELIKTKSRGRAGILLEEPILTFDDDEKQKKGGK